MNARTIIDPTKTSKNRNYNTHFQKYSLIKYEQEIYKTHRINKVSFRFSNLLMIPRS